MSNSEKDIELVNDLIDKLDPKYFFFDLPLYEVIELPTQTDLNKARIILEYKPEESFDSYNFKIGENSTFQGGRSNINNALPEDGMFTVVEVKIWCRRTQEIYRFFVLIDGCSLQKVGQYPSMADLHIGRIKQYRKVLTDASLREFVRAMGLRAYGVGIGSYVYLRRIFEGLIEEAHQRAEKQDDWDNTVFLQSRMAEKINLLQDFLPKFLVENKEIYSVLSLGIHELSEEECLKYFDAIKLGIEEILDEKVIEEQREQKRKSTQKLIAKVKQEIAKK